MLSVHLAGLFAGSTGCSPVESLHSVAGSDTVRNDARLSIGSKNSQGSSLDMVSEDSNCVDLREVQCLPTGMIVCQRHAHKASS